MARELEEFPASRRGRYDWENWFNGKAWELVQGEDFAIPIDNFRSAASMAARDHDGKVRTRKTGEKTLVIQFYTPSKS